MTSMLTKAQAWFLYYGKAALHTFWQAALASLVVGFGGAGLDLAHLTDLSAWQKIATAAVIAGIGAVASWIKQLVVLPKPGTVPAAEGDQLDHELPETAEPGPDEMMQRLAGTPAQ